MPPVVRQQSAKPKPAPNPVLVADMDASGTGYDPWGAADDGMRVLLYGTSGTGKTTLAATFPGPILWLICSGGDKPGEMRSIDTPELRRKIQPRVIQSVDQFYECLSTALEAGQDIRSVENLGRIKCRFGTVVLDHATGFADMVLSEIIGKPIPAQKAWGLATMQQYGQQGLRIKDALRKMLSMSCNAVVIAQERTFNSKDEQGAAVETNDGIRPTVGAALSPSVVGWLNPSCDYVVQTYKRTRTEIREHEMAGKKLTTEHKTREIEYCLRTGPHDTITTKFRLPRGRPLPDCLVDPSFEKLQAVIKGD